MALAGGDNVDFQLAPREDSTLSSVSAISLNRTTEKEGLIVDEGFCDIEDPSFGDAADRLATMEKEESEPPSPHTSSRSLKSRVTAGATDGSKRPPVRGGNSGRSLKANSSRSLGGFSESRRSQHPSDSFKESGRTSYDSNQSQGAFQSVDSGLSYGGGEGLPPGSPFGDPSFQSLEFQSPSVKDAAAKLDSMGVDGRLLSGLKSLSQDELGVYLQLTEELNKERQSLDGLSQTASDTGPGNGGGGLHTGKDDERLLEDAIRKLRALLPASAIEQLQTHQSYGLMDMLQATAASTAPPPTPASPPSPDRGT